MESNALSIGSLLKHGEYCITGVLGQGGFGITYQAEQVSLGRKVAVKEFFMKEYCERDGSTSHVTLGTSSGSKELVEKFRQKFVREARMIAALDHEHIVKIHDVFEENGTAYYVMEYLDGGSLDSMIRDDGAMPETVALGYIRQIADALQYLHKRNILHFDVKPSNVLLNENGIAKLIDFGISKHYDESGSQTSSTPVGVSKGFAPLEQYQQGGDIKTFTPATDIYALGATLFALVTGTNPPDASVVNEDGIPFIEGISASVLHAIECAMQPKRKDRPQSVSGFLDMLHPTSSGDSTNVVTPEAGQTDCGEDETRVIESACSQKSADSSHKSFSQRKLIYGLILCAFIPVLVLVLRSILPDKPTPVPDELTAVADSLLIDGVSEYTAEFSCDKSERGFAIDKNFDGMWSYSGVASWIAVRWVDNRLVVAVQENTSPDVRNATLAFSKKGDADVLAKLHIVQKGSAAKPSKIPEKENVSLSVSATTGTLVVRSVPSDASIMIDGKDTGHKTPFTFDNIKSGKHNLMLTKPEYDTWMQSVSISVGDITELNVTMKETVVETEESVSEESEVLATAEAEKMPEFPGGTAALQAYLKENIKYPEVCRKNNIQGRVLIQFIVNKDGSIVEAEVVKSVDPNLDNEALRVVSNMPNWSPGVQRGKPVRVRYTIPVNFRFK